MSIQANLLEIKNQLPENVTLVAVSKTKPVSDLQEAYLTGQRIFGENKIQEMTDKWEQLPKDIEWHMIGHVQTNKVKYMAPYVHLIHGVDSLKLLIEINKQAVKNNRIINLNNNEMQEGTVKFFNETKGFGFISQSNGNEDVFAHNSGLMENVRENDEVTFDIERGQKGLMAVNVKRK